MKQYHAKIELGFAAAIPNLLQDEFCDRALLFPGSSFLESQRGIDKPPKRRKSVAPDGGGLIGKVVSVRFDDRNAPQNQAPPIGFEVGLLSFSRLEEKTVQGLIAEHPDWGRTRLSEALCRRWDWRNAQGRFKDMAARTLLLKLERGGLIRLPRRQRPSSNGLRNRQAPLVAHATEPIRDALGDLRPLRLSVVESGSADLQLFNCLLRRYHYLGHRNTVGENLRYLARDLGCRCSDRPRGSAPRAMPSSDGNAGRGNTTSRA